MVDNGQHMFTGRNPALEGITANFTQVSPRRGSSVGDLYWFLGKPRGTAGIRRTLAVPYGKLHAVGDHAAAAPGKINSPDVLSRCAET